MKIKAAFFIAVFFLFATITSYAQELKVAVAANLQGVIRVLGKDLNLQQVLTYNLL